MNQMNSAIHILFHAQLSTVVGVSWWHVVALVETWNLGDWGKSGTGKQFLAVIHPLMTKCGMPLASRPTCTATTCKSWFVKLETGATHTRQQQKQKYISIAHPYCHWEMQNYCWWEIRKLKMTNPSEIYASSKSCDLGEDRNGVPAARRMNEQKWDCASGFVRCSQIQ